jgi:hypothetical protein
MITKDRGLFDDGSGNLLLVSALPTGAFQQRTLVVLAARVLGKESVEIPMVGKTLVPHLSFLLPTLPGTKLRRHPALDEHEVELTGCRHRDEPRQSVTCQTYGNTPNCD